MGTETDFSSYRNELQWEPEDVWWDRIGTILIKIRMYWYVCMYVCMYVGR